MRYFYKLLLSMLLLLTVALSIMEYSCVAFSLEHSFQRQRDSGLTEHQLVKHTIQSAILNTGGAASDAQLLAIGKNAAELLNAGGSLMLSGGEDLSYYSSLSIVTTLVDIEDGKLSFEVRESNAGDTFLLVKSSFSWNGRKLFLVTEQNISQIFVEADALRKQCTRIYFSILGVCVLVALGLAFALTRPLNILRRASREFSDGNYGARADLHRKDEVGELAGAYNKMAETIEEKIYQLEEAAQKQKRFTINFAHELKTPMTSIIGYADTIYQKNLSPEETIQAAWYIMNEGMRLESLSFKLMDLFTLDRRDFTLEETEITTLLQDVSATALPLSQKRSVEFVYQAEKGWVRLEYDLFKTLLLNLIDNAMNSGSSRVLLRGFVDGENYHICVSDNGRGIPAEELSKITEAFYMIDKSRSRREHGAGLGLALCSRIAEIHGTRLEYFSEPGDGTSVSLILKMEVDRDEA